MNYYIDTEFLEGTQKEKFPISLFRKNTPPTIDLISIGIVAEDNREYYAISKDFNLKEAWNRYDLKKEYPDDSESGAVSRKIYWIRENVLRPIFDELLSKSMQDKGDFVKNNFFTAYSGFSYSHLKALINYYGKTNKQIAEEIKDFISRKEFINSGLFSKSLNKGFNEKSSYDERMEWINNNEGSPEFYAYYADYDWVAFCWLFGKMMDLPKGFPMYCIDLKQMLDEKENSLKNNEGKIEIKGSYVESVGAFECFSFSSIKDISNYPKQENEHNALADARWNKELHEFLKSI
jgi:hypothetical protein